MSYNISKPRYPLNPDTENGIYPFLASVGIPIQTLYGACVEKMRVVAITSLQTVNVLDSNGTTYYDVPIWVHTDVGARAAAVKGVEATAEDYFKHAALMFTFPGHDEDTYAYVSVLTKSVQVDDEIVVQVIAIIEVLQSPAGVGFVTAPQHLVATKTTQLIHARPTYRPYIKLEIGVRRGMYGISSYWHSYIDVFWGLFDLITGKMAYIPTYDGSVPGEPYHRSNFVYKDGFSPEFYYYDNDDGAWINVQAWSQSTLEPDLDSDNMEWFIDDSIITGLTGIHIDAVTFGDSYTGYNDSDPGYPGYNMAHTDEETQNLTEYSSGLVPQDEPNDREYNVNTSPEGNSYVHVLYSNWIWIDPENPIGGWYDDYEEHIILRSGHRIVDDTGYFNTSIDLGTNLSSRTTTWTKIADTEVTYSLSCEIDFEYNFERNQTSGSEGHGTKASIRVSTREVGFQEIEVLLADTWLERPTASGKFEGTVWVGMTNGAHFMSFYENFYVNEFIGLATVFGRIRHQSWDEDLSTYVTVPEDTMRFIPVQYGDPNKTTPFMSNFDLLNLFDHAFQGLKDRIAVGDLWDTDDWHVGLCQTVKSELVFVQSDLRIETYDEPGAV